MINVRFHFIPLTDFTKVVKLLVYDNLWAFGMLDMHGRRL